MKIKVMHTGTLDNIAHISPAFKRLEKMHVMEHSNRYWNRKRQNTYSHDFQMIIIGKTGYGKSTTMNALLGQNIMASSNVEACTRDVQSFEFKLRERSYFSIADFPGIGESIDRDAEYLNLYKMMLCKTDVILYLLRADMRDFSIDKQAIEYLFSGQSNYKKNLIFGLNFSDKIEPLSRQESFRPSKEQLANLESKIKSIKDVFSGTNTIVPYSAVMKWNLDALANEVINTISKSGYIKA